MNITELVAQYREEARDSADPPFLSDAVVVGLYNEAEDEACRRKDLIFDNSTTAVCTIAVTSATSVYALHASVVKVTKAYLVSGSDVTYLKIFDRDELDRVDPLWRESTDSPYGIIVDEKNVQIVPALVASYSLKLEVYRTPIAAMALPVSPATAVSPEIATAHHRYLYHWVLHRAFSKPDADLYSPKEAKDHFDKFSRYFGPRVTADRGRSSRANRPHTNKVWL